jgi:hypothetical protein
MVDDLSLSALGMVCSYHLYMRSYRNGVVCQGLGLPSLNDRRYVSLVIPPKAVYSAINRIGWCKDLQGPTTLLNDPYIADYKAVARTKDGILRPDVSLGPQSVSLGSCNFFPFEGQSMR